MLTLLVFTVLLLVVMPALLLGVGYFAQHATKGTPSWIGFPTRPTSNLPAANQPAAKPRPEEVGDPD